jgi:RNase adaptor protein for sRNA GlmZ degradation
MTTTAMRFAAAPPAVHLVSFGYGHGQPPPGAHLTVDVRQHFRDPHADPALRCLTAANGQVMRAVLATQGIPDLIAALVAAARACLAGPQPGPVLVAVGCAGGRHRSAAIVTEAARRLSRAGLPVTVTHRDIARPVIIRPTP